MGSRAIVNIGVQQFDKVREQNAFYIDKTGFIKEWWEGGSDVTLITRPRRFGKTLNMSMVDCFFSNKYAGRGDLFEGLEIWKEEQYRLLQGTYPVIFLSFANIKADCYEDMVYMITEVVSELYGQNRYLLEGSLLSGNEKEYYENIKPGMESRVARGSIHSMASFMSRYFGKKVIIILDEYDTPMQEAWLFGYWDEAAVFFRGLFNSSFKTNGYMERGLITGITRISKESVFSDLNHIDVITTTSDEYAISFGFTEEEVFQALDNMGLGSEKQGVKHWYDGFSFGRHTDIYNPWSVVSFIGKKGKYDAYWSNTSGNGLINSLVQGGNACIKRTMEKLIQGESFEAVIDEQVVFTQLNGNADAVWSLLLATGYLKVVGMVKRGADEETCYTLALTNFEVARMFRKMVKSWFEGGNTQVYYNEFIQSLLNDNVKKMNTFMNKVALETFSSFDSGNKPSEASEPERFYHGFVLGMVVSLADKYKVRSNRESGYGRYDVMIVPLDRTAKAFIIEFKVIDPDDEEETLEDTIANAHMQIEQKRYETELTASGFAPEQIRKYAFAFQGKKCLIG